MKALIDGDVIVYQAGHASDIREYHVGGATFKYMKDAKEYAKANAPLAPIKKIISPEPIEHCLNSVKKMIMSILEATDADEQEIYLTDDKKENNFRHVVFPEYKANRDAASRPLWYKEIRQYMIDVWEAVVITGSEADDALGCVQSVHNNVLPLDSETCICTIDKDLDMIRGWHYNWNKNEMYWVEQEEADKNFWKQMLTGDISDNIPGIKGVGPKTAEKLIDPCIHNNYVMYTVVYDKWMWSIKGKRSTSKVDSILDRNGRLLWIQRKPDQSWQEGLGLETNTKDT